MIPLTYCNILLFIIQLSNKSQVLSILSENLSYNVLFSFEGIMYISPKGKTALVSQYKSYIDFYIRTFVGHYVPVGWFLLKGGQKHRLIYTLISLYIKYIWCILSTKNNNIINKDHVYLKRGCVNDNVYLKMPCVNDNVYIISTLFGDLMSFIPYVVYKLNK